MKILLVNPNRSYVEGSKGVNLGIPLGLLYLAASLEKNGFEVAVLDCLSLKETQITETKDSIFFGVEDPVFIEKVKELSPDVVGIGAPFTAQFENTLKASELVRDHLANATIVLGGPHASVAGRDILSRHQHIDYVIAGEGEYAFPLLLRAINEKTHDGLKSIPGLMWRNNDGDDLSEISANPIQVIEDLDNIPLPAYHLIDMERHFKLQEKGLFSRPYCAQRSISVITSRGCPYTCVFCSIHLSMGRKWRFHSVEYVIGHLQKLIEIYGVRHVHFEDDNFTFKRSRANKISLRMIEENIGITWDTPNGVRADTLNDETLANFKKSGCSSLVVAAESGDQYVVNNIVKKKIDLSSICKISELCNRHEIRLNCFFVIGFPGETKKNINKTLDFALTLFRKYNCNPNLMVAAPLLGTELLITAQENGYLIRDLTPRNLSRASSVKGEGMIATPEFDPEYLKERIDFFKKRLALIQKLKICSDIRNWPSIVKAIFRKVV